MTAYCLGSDVSYEFTVMEVIKMHRHEIRLINRILKLQERLRGEIQIL
jgi:hypothetical protein